MTKKDKPIISKDKLEKYAGIIKEKLSDINPIKAIVYYFDDRISRNFIPYDIYTNETIFEIPNSDLAFILTEPAIYRKGIPIYWCVRIQEKCMSFTIEFNAENDKLILSENYLSPAESYATQKSNARTSILKKEKYNFTQSVITLLCCIITGLTVYTICIPFFKG